MIHRLSLAGLCPALALALASSSALAQLEIEAGDALVLDLAGNSVIGVKLSDSLPLWSEGDQFAVPSGGPVTYPRGLAIASDWSLFISGNSQVIRVQADNDQQDLVTQFFAVSRGITFDEAEAELFVAAPPTGSYTPVIVRVDRATGFQRLVSAWFVYPRDVALDPGDTTKLLVVESQGVIPFEGIGVYQVDPANPDDSPMPISTNAAADPDPDVDFSFPQRLVANEDYIYVADPGFGEAPPKVLRVDRANTDPEANHEVVAFGGDLVYPIGIAIEESGSLLVADADAQAVIRIFPDDYVPGSPPETDNQEIVSQGGLFDTPWEIQIVPAHDPIPSRDFFVSDPGANSVYQVDPNLEENERRTFTWSDGSFHPAAIALDLEGNLVVTDIQAKKIFRLYPANPVPDEVEVEVAPGAELEEPTGIVVDSTGDYLVCDRGAGAIIRVLDPMGPEPARQQVAAVGEHLVQPVSAALDDEGFLIVADAGDASDPQDPENPIPPSIVRVNPATATQDLLASGSGFPDPRGVFRDADGSILVAGAGEVKVFRGLPSVLDFFPESISEDLETPESVTVDANRDILVLDAGDEGTTNDGIVQKIDPLDPIDASPTAVLTDGPFYDPFGITINIAPVAPVLDDDEDGVPDSRDTCQEVQNPGDLQADTNSDGIGNRCDADYVNDGVVNGQDLLRLRAAWGACPGDLNYDIDVDLKPKDDPANRIGMQELILLINQWQGPPGPGLPGCDGKTIPCPPD